MTIICKCGNNAKNLCIKNSCKNCCSDSECKIHNLINCASCNIKKFGLHCNNFKCIDCCNNKCCQNSEHRNKFTKCLCGKNKFTTNCIIKKCLDCCDNELCIAHKQKFNRCIKCNISEFNCEYKYCKNCCNNNKCNKHFILCNCSINFTSKNCRYYKCKNCCINRKCHIHYVQDLDLTTELLNNYKINLYKSNKLPTEIINKIIDEYVDARIKCSICSYKINFNNDISNGVIVNCVDCNNWVCDGYNDCSKSTYNDHHIYNYCIECYSYSDNEHNSDEEV
jgi:hypothetical protein